MLKGLFKVKTKRTVPDRRWELKVKIMSLAAETKIIRQQERKLQSTVMPPSRMQYWSLRHHRLDVVRPETRHAHLAYGFIRERPYKKVENKVRPGNEPDWNRVAEIAARFLLAPFDKGSKPLEPVLREVKEWAAAGA